MLCVCVCVCVCFGSWMLCIFLLRDVFESLTCCLDLWLSSLLDYIPLFDKLLFLKLDNFSTDPRQVAIYRDPWTSFLDRSYRIFDPSSYLEFVSIAFWEILDPSRKFLSGCWLLDSFSIHRGDFAINRFSTAPQQIHIYQDLVLNRSRQILGPSRCILFKYLQCEI